MFGQFHKTDFSKPLFYFCIGFCVVLLGSWFPVLNGLDTYINFWRVETIASFFLLLLFLYLFFYSSYILNFNLFQKEIKFILIPFLGFILWSSLSMIWAESWKSALYHTLIWSEYLIFYLIIRSLLKNTAFYRLLINCLIVMLLLIALPAIFEYCGYLYLGGSTSLGIRFAKYGELFLVLFPLIIAGILRLNGRFFLLGICVVSAIWLFMVSTLSRTNFALFLLGFAGIAFFVFFLKQFRKYRIKFLLLILSLIGSFTLIHSVALLAEKPAIPLAGRITDEVSTVYSNNFRKLMIPIAAEMIISHPVNGIGAGNFGIQFNKYRQIYAEKSPNDINLITAERELAERAHNEYLQVFAELGIIGLIIFLSLLSSIGLMTLNLLKKIHKVSLFPISVLVGLYLFLISSMLTSFSFRFMQNGLVFFTVLAIGSKLLLKTQLLTKSVREKILPPQFLKIGVGFGIIICMMMLWYCGYRVTSSFYNIQARNNPNPEEAIPLYQKAIQIDDENPNPKFFLGTVLLNSKRYSEAIPYFKQAILQGLGTSGTYSYLATAQTFAGNSTEAEQDFADAVKLYPQSVFAHTRYAYLLLNANQPEKAEQQLKIASEIDKKQTNTWWSLMNSGLPETVKTSFQNNDYVSVENLPLSDCVSAITFERELKNPSEKTSFNFDGFINSLPN